MVGDGSQSVDDREPTRFEFCYSLELGLAKLDGIESEEAMCGGHVRHALPALFAGLW